jgi:hypothetical protein
LICINAHRGQGRASCFSATFVSIAGDRAGQVKAGGDIPRFVLAGPRALSFMVLAEPQAPIQLEKPSILIIFSEAIGQLNVSVSGGDIMGLAVNRCCSGTLVQCYAGDMEQAKSLISLKYPNT